MALRISRQFKDISLSFARHPVTNDILVIKNEDAIKKSVTNLVRTIIGERVYQPILGTSIDSALFELASEEVSIILKEEIETLLRNYEKRIKLNKVKVEMPPDTNDIVINIEYDIVGLGFPNQSIEFLLQPTRI